MRKEEIIGIISIVIIIVSIANLGMKITGYANQGIVNITIDPIVVINFTISNIDFGSGGVSLGYSNATIDTLGNVIRGNWTSVTQGFEIENIGNVNISLDLRTNKTANEFIGGSNPNPEYKYNVTDLESGSCYGGGIMLGQWNNVNTTGDGDRICGTFLSNLNSNSIRVDVKLVIPSSARGKKSDVFTATGTAI